LLSKSVTDSTVNVSAIGLIRCSWMLAIMQRYCQDTCTLVFIFFKFTYITEVIILKFPYRPIQPVSFACCRFYWIIPIVYIGGRDWNTEKYCLIYSPFSDWNGIVTVRIVIDLRTRLIFLLIYCLNLSQTWWQILRYASSRSVTKCVLNRLMIA